MYSMTIPQLSKMLGNLKAFIEKAEAHAEEQKFKVDVLAGGYLVPDQFNFTRQVQSACDNAKGIAARLAGQEIPSHPDTEKTMEDLKARLDKTIAYLDGFSEADFEGWEGRQARFGFLPNMHVEGFPYLVEFGLPNFYFHVVTAYAILRHNGVNLGKMNYLGHVPFKPDTP